MLWKLVPSYYWKHTLECLLEDTVGLFGTFYFAHRVSRLGTFFWKKQTMFSIWTSILVWSTPCLVLQPCFNKWEHHALYSNCVFKSWTPCFLFKPVFLSRYMMPSINTMIYKFSTPCLVFRTMFKSMGTWCFQKLNTMLFIRTSFLNLVHYAFY